VTGGYSLTTVLYRYRSVLVLTDPSKVAGGLNRTLDIAYSMDILRKPTSGWNICPTDLYQGAPPEMTKQSANPRRYSRGASSLDPNQPIAVYLALQVGQRELDSTISRICLNSTQMPT
jgi:hypothetical protein